jgi:xylan 1,4-beta-xylosidase
VSCSGLSVKRFAGRRSFVAGRVVLVAGLFGFAWLLAGCPSSSPADGSGDADDGATVAAARTLTLGAAISGAAVRPLLGVNIGPIPAGSDPNNADLTTAYQQVGVTQVRVHDYYGPLDMATMYPDQSADPSLAGSYDFAASDTVFSAILAGGFEPYLRLGDSYNNGVGYPAADPRKPTNRANWVAAAVEVVRHYSDAGRWGRNPLHYVEIWNEPDNAQFWDGTTIEFFQLFEQVAKGLKAEFPSLMIGGPGLAPGSSLSEGGRAWTQQFLEYQQSKGTPLDFFSWHLYTNEPAEFASGAEFFRAELDSHGYTATESHVTEYNTRAEGAGAADAVALRAGARGAAIMTAGWIAMQEQGVAAATFYRGPDPELDFPQFYGMFYADGEPKKMALAFSLWHTLAATYTERVAVTASTGSDGLTVHVLAGRDANGRVAVLVANVNATATTYDVQLASGAKANAAQLTIQQVSDAAAAVETVTSSSGTITLPGYGVQLVRLAE